MSHHEGKENDYDYQEKLLESPGTKILKYVKSEFFGIKGEPVKISENI